MTNALHPRINDIFSLLGCASILTGNEGLAVTTPTDGGVIAHLALDNAESARDKIAQAKKAQGMFHTLDRTARVVLVEKLSAHIRQYREVLAECITLEAGKTPKEAAGEVDSSADVLLKTVKNTQLADLSGMARTKERPPVGVVGLITSFNFPLVVANWTLAPALLAANAIVWKPSEKTPLTAIAFKAVFDKAFGDHKDVLQVLIGGREVGSALVEDEMVDMISATGSVAMGKGIKTALAKKKNNIVPPVLELGGNNGVIISDKISESHLEWALSCLLNSFLGTTGQRCTNTRRLIVHQSLYDKAVEIFTRKITNFNWDDYGYGALIDADAYTRFEHAKKQAMAEGGKIIMGKRLRETEFPNGFYVEPALVLLPSHSSIMEEETFAPLLFIIPYNGDIEEAIALLNKPANAGLVSGIYTQSQKEADRFAQTTQAGHALVNSPKGTGTPAFDMGFGGNKASGEGEILNAADPLRAFTRDTHFTRIAQNKEIVMDKD